MKKRLLSILLIIAIVMSLASCSTPVKSDNIEKFSIIEQAEIIGDFKSNKNDNSDASIEIKFPNAVTFDSVVLREKGNQVTQFSIYVKDSNGDYTKVYQQDKIGEYRYCSIGEYTTDTIKIYIENATDNKYEIKDIDVLNVHDNENEDFRVTSYIVCPTFYANGKFEEEKLKSITDVILFGIARFDEKGNVYLQDAEINGETISGDEIFTTIIDGIRKANSNIKIYCNALGPDGTDTDDKEKLHSQAFIENGDNLSTNIVDLLDKYDFDGFFFDYEYPYQKQSKKDYSEFIVKLDAKLGDYILGASLSHWNCDLTKDAINALDRVEIMAYDDMSGKTHSDFASYGGGLAILSFEKQGYDLSKCDLGLPFYGRTHNGEEPWPSYAQIAPDLKENIYLNTVDKSYLDGEKNVNVYTSFNGVQMIKDKTAFANDYGVGGVMVWHYSCDVPYESDMSLFKAIQTALNSRDDK